MQILPNFYSYEAPSIISAEGGEPGINQSSPFAEVMNNIKNHAEKLSESAPLKRSDKHVSAADKAIGEGAEVTKQDLARMRQKLEDRGLSKEDIKTLEEQIDSEEGLTWGGLLEFVSEKLGFKLESLMPELTPAMKNDLAVLFRKMGFDHEQSQALIRDLESGKQDKVWQTLSGRVAGMAEQDLGTITRGELKTLGKALGLPADSMKRLDGMLGFADMETVSPKGARIALDTIFSDAKKLQQELADTLGELRSVIQEGMKKSRAAKDSLALADNRETKEVAAAKVMIKDEARKQRGEGVEDENASAAARDGKDGKNGKENAPLSKDAANAADAKDAKANDSRLNDAKANDAKANDAKAKAEDSSRQGLAGQDDKSRKAEPEGADPRDTLARTRQARRDEALAGDKAGAEQKNDGEQGKQSKDSDAKAWDQLWSKVEARGGRTAGETLLNQNNEAKAGEFSLKTENAEVLLGEKVPPQRIARTVQQGILQNLSQGGKQLTLRMDPPSLGKLTVILQVHNNEVRALIKTENHEATRLVNDQLNLIRHSLEQQGLKVEKLDVQTQANNDQGQNWQGAEQHNMLQERNRESLQAFMTMRKGRGAQGEGLAREVQSEGTGAHLAHQHQGLHLIA